MRISVLVTTFGRPTYLERCVASLLGQRRAPDEIILVTRSSDSATQACVRNLLARHGSEMTLRHARVEKPGVLAANLAGFPLVTGDIISFIDDDAAAHPDWLERIEARFASDPTLGAVGGRDVLHVHEGEGGIVQDKASRVGEITWYGRITGNHEKVVGGAHYVEHLKGVNMSFRTSLVPPFDERILGNAHYYEMDLCFGVRRQGYRILYDSEIVVDHYQTAPRFLPGNAIAADPQREFFLNHNMVYVMMKNLGPARRAIFLAYTFTRDPFVGAAKLLLRWRGTTAAQVGAMVKGKIAGLREYGRAKKARRAASRAKDTKSTSLRRILYLSPAAGLGGAERCLLEIVRELPRDRYEAHLLVPRPGPLIEAAGALGARVHVCRWPDTALKVGRERGLRNRVLAPVLPLVLLPTALRVARYAKSCSVDLIHTNGTKAHVVGSMASFFSGIPVVWHLRDVLAPGPLRFLLRALGRISPSRIIANSRATAESMSSMSSMSSTPVAGGHARIILIHDGISLEEFKSRDTNPRLRSSLGLGAEQFVIGTVGALAPLKGHLHLIRAMPGVLQSAPESRLLIVGEEMYETLGHQGYRRLLEDEVVRLHLDGKVVFAGSRDDVALLYNIMDLVTLCSVRPESFGRTLVEAMACRRPVIATDLGGPKEILAEAGAGLLVPPARPEALTGAILELHGDPERRARMGEAGRARVAALFSLDTTMKAIRQLYAELLEAPGIGAAEGVNEAAR